MPRPPSLKEYMKGLSHTIYFCTCNTKKKKIKCTREENGGSTLKCVTYGISEYRGGGRISMRIFIKKKIYTPARGIKK